MKTHTLEDAIDLIGAQRDAPGTYIYYAEEVSNLFRVSDEDMEFLVICMNNEPDDPYGHWCAGTHAEEARKCDCGEIYQAPCTATWQWDDNPVTIHWIPPYLRGTFHTLRGNGNGLWATLELHPDCHASLEIDSDEECYFDLTHEPVTKS